MPVMEGDNIVGSVTENTVLTYLLENPLQNSERLVGTIMNEAFPIVGEDLTIKQLSKYINRKIPAVLARDRAGNLHIITQYDIIQAV